MPTAVPPPGAPLRVHEDTSRPIALAVAYNELWMLDVKSSILLLKGISLCSPQKTQSKEYMLIF